MAASCSRTTGVAPLSVHFDASCVTSTSTIRSFHNYEYNWGFDDPTSGTWGTTGKSKNSAKGAVATHVFETPGTYSVSLSVVNIAGAVVDAATFSITVDNPGVIYSGAATICVCDTANSDFTSAPTGATQITTDELSNIISVVIATRRLLFHRGSEWTTSELVIPDNSGPVTIGAFGSGTGADSLGFYSNNPVINVDGSLATDVWIDVNGKQDWRFMDMKLIALNSLMNGSVTGGTETQRILQLRLYCDEWYAPIGWGHWNIASLMQQDQMVVQNCQCYNNKDYAFYGGGERMALLGNIFEDSENSHVARVWQAWKSVIQHNRFSGASWGNANGRHALKFHGPAETGGGDIYQNPPNPYTANLAQRTRFTVISDNIFGSSGPWPVGIGPPDGTSDCAIQDILIERNRFISEYGAQSATPVTNSLMVWARYVTVRNNIFDGSNISTDYTGVHICQREIEPTPVGVEVHNNTVYKNDNTTGNGRFGVYIESECADTVVKNNLVSFPEVDHYPSIDSDAVRDYSADGDISNNLLMYDATGFIDPNNADPLSRDFSLSIGSAAIDAGIQVYVFEDFNNNARDSYPDLGAYEYGAGLNPWMMIYG